MQRLLLVNNKNELTFVVFSSDCNSYSVFIFVTFNINES